MTVDTTLDGWMRHEAAFVLARLIRRFGWDRVEIVEDAMQDALIRAVETWPFKGVPERPSAWLYTVASNRALDTLRSAAARRGVPLSETLERELASEDDVPHLNAGELSDPELDVLFALSHPALDPKSAIALTLQVLSGFSLGAIASALVMKEDAVAQLLSRAKKNLRGIPDVAVAPHGAALQARLSVALDVIALLFNEGFEPSSGDQAMRPDLCAEAVRLADALTRHPITAGPASQALAALLNLLMARVPARLAHPGAVTLLAEQDRATWSQPHLRRGLGLLAASASGDHLSRYHLLAGIAGTHAAASSLETTDWTAIVAAYRLLIELEDSPVHRLNLAVALLHGGDEAGAAAEIRRLAGHPQMERYFWFHVTQAEILGELGAHNESRAALVVALALAKTPAQAEIVRGKLAQVQPVVPNAR